MGKPSDSQGFGNWRGDVFQTNFGKFCGFSSSCALLLTPHTPSHRHAPAAPAWKKLFRTSFYPSHIFQDFRMLSLLGWKLCASDVFSFLLQSNLDQIVSSTFKESTNSPLENPASQTYEKLILFLKCGYQNIFGWSKLDCTCFSNRITVLIFTSLLKFSQNKS